MTEKPIEIHLAPFIFIHAYNFTPVRDMPFHRNKYQGNGWWWLLADWRSILLSRLGKGEIISNKNLDSYSFKHDYLKLSSYPGRSCIYIKQALSFVYIIPLNSKLQESKRLSSSQEYFSANVHIMLSLSVINNFKRNEGLQVISYIQLVQLQPYEDPKESPEIVQQVAGHQVTNWQKHKLLLYPFRSQIPYQQSNEQGWKLLWSKIHGSVHYLR